jgi:kinesin family protein 2/24
LDKRSARLRFSNEFSAEIAKFRRDSLSSATTNAATPTPTTPPAAAVASSDVSVFVRKRPMFAHETARNDFDVVADSATKENSDDTVAGTVTVYRTVMHADMKTCMVQPVHFNCTEFFDETCESAQVYHAAALPLVQAAQQGGVATLLMFGQTGSGKTYTMTALEELCAEELFERRTGCGKVAVTVQFLELCGKICRDLVDDAGQEVRIMDNDNGSVCFVNAAEAVADDAQELCAVIAKAKERRATQVTDKNDESSRSHAVCQLTIRDESSPQQRGVLTLVDCAGTERRNDSLYHSRSRQAESKEINASLYALKECIRARSSQRKDRHVPYRSNNLTRVLRESLERADARLAVIATVAPNATDTEHTIQTLKTIATLSGGAPEEGQLQKLTPLVDKSGGLPIAPKKWNHGALIAWLTEKRLIQKQQQIPEHFDGRFVMRMSKLQLRNAFYGDGEMAKAELLFKYLRSETDRANRLDLKRRMNKPN